MRVGIMSFAHVHADAYLHILRNMQGVDFVGFSDTNAQQGKHYADLYNATWFASHEALFAQGLDAVVICSENAQHLSDVELACKAGLHILCEKPIATTLEDAETIRNLVDDAGVTFMTAFPMRFDPSIVSLKTMLDRGDLGDVYAINGTNHSEIPKRHRAWFASKELAGGGAVMDHTVHLLDLYRWLLKSEPASIYAEVSNPFNSSVEVDMAGLATITFDNGVFTAIDCSWSRTEAIYPRWGHLKMELFGEKGAIEIDAFSQHVALYSKTSERQANWLGWGSDSNTFMIQEFIDSVREQRVPLVSLNDGFEALKVALKVYEASSLQKAVNY